MTPQLRFPKFTDEWQVKKLGDIAPLQRGFDLPNSQQKPGEYPIVFSNGPLKTHHMYTATAPGVVTGRSGTIGKVHFIEKDYWPHNTSLWVTDFKNNSPKYIYYIYKNMRLERFGGGSTVPTLNRNDVHAQKIVIPQKPEQEKIAEFLTTVDARISNSEKMLKLLQQYKKGVMQKIFTQEFQFKNENGNPYPEWGEKQLKNLVSIKTGKKDVNQGNPHGTYPFFTCARKHTYSDEYSFEGESIMIAGNGEVGLCTYYNGKFEAYQRTYILQDFKIPANYLFIYLKEAFQTFAESQKQQGSMPYIKLSTLQDFKIPVQSKEEQQKIATFLTALDDKISAEQTRLTAARQWKKGLLQRMFV